MHSPLEIRQKNAILSCLSHVLISTWPRKTEALIMLFCSQALCYLLLSYMQRNATTPNIVWPTMLGVLYKRMQQLATMLVPAVHCEKVTTHKTLETMCVSLTMLGELCKRIQHCCTTPRCSQNKRNVRSC